MIGAAAIPGKRGCGTRVQAGAYVESGLGPGGAPVEYFLIDAPIPSAGLGIPARGVLPVCRDGIWHVLDRVGMEGYLNTADFVEEVRRMGLSRRIPKTFDLSLLSEGSRIYLAHDRALILNPMDYPGWRCPKQIRGHDYSRVTTNMSVISAAEAPSPCVGVCWHDIDGGTPVSEEQEPFDLRVLRTMPGFSYTAWKKPEGVTPQYRQALFLALPITRLVVVKGNDHEEVSKKAREARLPFAEVDE